MNLKCTLLLLTSLLPCQALPAQSIENVTTYQDPTNPTHYHLEWPAYQGHTYYLQTSFDLINWTTDPNYLIGTSMLETLTIENLTPDPTFFARIISYTGGPNDDNDGDGLTNDFETLITKTDPNSADTDGDGVPDGDEYSAQSDPLDQSSAPAFVVEVTYPAVPDGLKSFLDTNLGYLTHNAPQIGIPLASPQDRTTWSLEFHNTFPLQSNLITFRRYQTLPTPKKINLLNLREVWLNDETHLDLLELEIPANSLSSTVQFASNDPLSTHGGYGTWKIFPLSMAPTVLAANTDFDEGRIDPATGYAIPDCDDLPGVDRKTGAGNSLLGLNAVRDHLDKEAIKAHKLTTDDLHPGWFGLHPLQLGADFWDGATVTIRKRDKIDPETGRNESGQIRFYSRWGHNNADYYGLVPYDLLTLTPNNFVTSGVNGKPGEGVYGSSSTIPAGAKYWMEGVRPGKITLEWRLQKGDIDVKHEQTFLVATQQSKQMWIDQVYYQVKLQSTGLIEELAGSPVLQIYPIDMNQFDPKNGFFKNSQNHNYAYIQSVYYYYQQLFIQNPEELYWAGMAKSAGASVYAGMGDMHIWWHTPWPLTPDANTRGKLDKVLDDFLVTGNKNIFRDMAWSHHAYVSSGIWALRYIEENTDDGEEPITDFAAWENIDAGIQDGDVAKSSKGNRDVLFREQNVVMPPLYNQMKLVWVTPHSLQWLQETFSSFVAPPTNASGEINMDETFSRNAQNPIDRDTGPMFRDLVPNGSLSNFNDRWAWIENPQKGMLQIWMGGATGTPAFNVAKRANFNGLQLYAHAIQYSMSKELPLE